MSAPLKQTPFSDRKWVLALGGTVLWLAVVYRLYATGGYTTLRAIILAILVGGLVAGAYRLADEFARVTDPKADPVQARQRARNLAIALSLAALVTLFYIATLVRLGANALNRPM